MYLWCQINPSITDLVLTLVLSALSPGLLIVYNTIIKKLDLGKDVRFIFCDISKAFDRVWHSGLIFKLRKYGICGNVLKWIEVSFMIENKELILMDTFLDGKLSMRGYPRDPPLAFCIPIIH